LLGYAARRRSRLLMSKLLGSLRPAAGSRSQASSG